MVDVAPVGYLVGRQLLLDPVLIRPSFGCLGLEERLRDLAVEHQPAFAVMLGNGDGTFGLRNDITASFSFPVDIVVGYVNGDSILDVVLEHLVPHAFSVFLGNGDGTFHDPVTYGTSSNPLGGIALGDLNGDGHQDVIAGAGTQVWVYSGNGDGTLRSESRSG